MTNMYLLQFIVQPQLSYEFIDLRSLLQKLSAWSTLCEH